MTSAFWSGGRVTAENYLGTAPPSYLCVVGYSWAVALEWKRVFPSEPFLGIRVDPEEVWVVFEPKTAAGPIPRPVFEQVAQAFEDTGAASISDNAFFYEGPSLGAAHRLARRVVSILQIGDYRRPPTQPLVRRLRCEQDLTQEQLARRAGITQGHLSHLESGTRENPGAATLKKLARALGVSVAELLE